MFVLLGCMLLIMVVVAAAAAAAAAVGTVGEAEKLAMIQLQGHFGGHG